MQETLASPSAKLRKPAALAPPALGLYFQNPETLFFVKTCLDMRPVPWLCRQYLCIIARRHLSTPPNTRLSNKKASLRRADGKDRRGGGLHENSPSRKSNASIRGGQAKKASQGKEPRKEPLRLDNGINKGEYRRSGSQNGQNQIRKPSESRRAQDSSVSARQFKVARSVLNIPILVELPEIVAINKPPAILSQPGLPGEGTILELLRFQRPDLTLQTVNRYILQLTLLRQT